MNKTEEPSLEYYLHFQYSVTIYSELDGGYVAQIKDLPGCLTQGESVNSAVLMLREHEQ